MKLSPWVALLFALFVANGRAAEFALKLPEKAAGMELPEVTDYEKDSPGGGVGWSYRSASVKADVYLYSLGLSPVPANLSSQEVAGHLQQIVDGVHAVARQGRYQDVKTTVSSELLAVGQFPFLHAELRYTEAKAPRISHIYLGVVKGQFLKVRFTYLLAEKAVGEKALSEFLQTMKRVLEAASS